MIKNTEAAVFFKKSEEELFNGLFSKDMSDSADRVSNRIINGLDLEIEDREAIVALVYQLKRASHSKEKIQEQVMLGYILKSIATNPKIAALDKLEMMCKFLEYDDLNLNTKGVEK